jgi:transcriptional regulator GlxA family with amidase domain
LWQNSAIDIQLRALNDFVSHLTPDETTAMLHALGMLEYLIATPNSKQMENVTRVMLMMMLLFTGLKDHHPISPTYSSMHQRQLFERFHDLVQHNHRRTRKIADYAEMMCLSAKYLSTMVKQLTGRSASAWIDDCLLDSAKMALASESKLTIQQIAISMGFVDQATFSKWFKRKHGLTPSQYRLLN